MIADYVIVIHTFLSFEHFFFRVLYRHQNKDRRCFGTRLEKILTQRLYDTFQIQTIYRYFSFYLFQFLSGFPKKFDFNVYS